MVSLAKLKSNVGTPTGTITIWTRELFNTDPINSENLKFLPSGYLRCDGSILNASDYPILSKILGTGINSRYKKENIELTDEQFQLPDLGSKKILASSSVGDDKYRHNNRSRTGIGLRIVNNTQENYIIQLGGYFYMPTQNYSFSGEMRVNRDIGFRTEIAEVEEDQIQPHGHFHSGQRTRVKNANGNDFANRQNNYKNTLSSLSVVDWEQHHFQPACAYHLIGRTSFSISRGGDRVGGYGATDGELAGCTCNCYLYEHDNGFQLPDISFSTITQGYCLFSDSYKRINGNSFPYTPIFKTTRHSTTTPKGTNYNIAERTSNSVSNNLDNGTISTEMRVHEGDGSKCDNGEGNGGIFDIFTRCLFEPAALLNGGRGCNNNNRLSDVRDHVRDINESVSNYSAATMPFDVTEPSNPSYTSVNNVTVRSQEVSGNTSHRHFINSEINNHNYSYRVNPTRILPQGLESTCRVSVSNIESENNYTQPYLIQEFVIKY